MKSSESTFATFTVRPKLRRSLKRTLKAERNMCAKVTDTASVNYEDAQARLKAIDLLLHRVRNGSPIRLADHMTLEERILSLEIGRTVGTVAEFILSAIRYRLSRVSEDGDESHDWRYLADLAALAADIKAVSAEPSPA
jgi:hypothetical protein